MLIDVSLSGDKQVQRRLLRIGGRAVHARPAFEMLATWLMGLEREQFESEGQRSSGGWAPLAESTVKAKGDSSILFDTGAEMASFTERGDPNQTLWATDEFLLFGAKLPYPGFQQTGTSRMPQRRPLELTAADRLVPPRIIQAHILGGEQAPVAMAAALGI
jgi:phage gpG-like protein